MATRARIIDQAAVAFARDGYDAASLTGDILEPAGVSVGSFYHQFDNKLDVLFALLAERQQALADDVQQIALDDAESVDLEGALTSLFVQIVDRVDADPDLSMIQLRERWNPDESVRFAVTRSWLPWRQGIERAVDRVVSDATAREAAINLVGSALIPTMGRYLDLSAAERPAWRATEVPALAAFCTAGVERLG